MAFPYYHTQLSITWSLVNISWWNNVRTPPLVPKLNKVYLMWKVIKKKKSCGRRYQFKVSYLFKGKELKKKIHWKFPLKPLPSTLGSQRLVCDTSTQIGHFKAKWTWNFNLIPKVIIVAPKSFQRFLFCIWEIFFKKIWEIFLEML